MRVSLSGGFCKFRCQPPGRLFVEICCPLQEDSRTTVTQDPPSGNERELQLLFQTAGAGPQLWWQEWSPMSLGRS